MFVNPLVSPGILGVLAGASFGAALGMLLSDHWFVVQILAFLFGFVAVAVSIMIGSMVTNSRSTIMLVLGGVISGSLFTALLSVIKYTADPYSTLPAIVYWLIRITSYNVCYTKLLRDTKMIPIAIEGYELVSNDLKNTKIQVDYADKIKERGMTYFGSMADTGDTPA